MNKKSSKISINLWRRSSQVFFFLILIFGGLLYLPQVNTDLLPFVQNSPDVKKISSLEAPKGYTEVFDTYTPFRTCRYLDGNRIFRACSLHYFTEVPVYGVPIYDFIPHFLFIVLLSFLFARMFCGWVCPLGAMSDFFGGVRKVLRLEKLKLSDKFLKALNKVKYIWISVLFILAVGIAVPYIGLSAFKNELFLVACQTCPARNLFPPLTGNVPGFFQFDNPITILFSVIGIMFLFAVFMGFFGKRIWCRFCPNGLILSLFNRGSLVVKEKDLRKCTKCGVCKRVCPMDNEKVYEEKENNNVNSRDCINCFTCVDKCPEDDCLSVKIAGKKIFRSKYKSKEK